MNSILDKLTSGQVNFDNYDDLIKLLIKDFLEHLMQSELTEHLNYEKHDPKGNNSGNSRNGSYLRSLDTKYGNIDNLQVPRDRNGDFNSALFQPYQRRDNWLEEMIIKLYSKGVSTREIAKIIEKMYGSHYSASTVSNITDVALKELETWHNRQLKKDTV
jgi:transposase-like protein